MKKEHKEEKLHSKEKLHQKKDEKKMVKKTEIKKTMHKAK